MALRVGDMVYFWTGRGSHGYATIRAFKGGLVQLDPEPDATKGSDYRILEGGKEYWRPRDAGVRPNQIDTPPQFWYKNF